VPQATLAECPKCGAKVRKDKLRRHISTVHAVGPKPAKGAAPAVATKVSTVVFPWKVIAVLVAAVVVVSGGYYVATRLPAGGTPGGSGTALAVMETNFGEIKITLDLIRAPKTTGHFISLVNAGKYDGNGFQRVAYNFVIQGGKGADSSKIAWELTGLKNVHYTVAMARVAGDINSATCEFFINLKDNAYLDAPPGEQPYVVFGRVTAGQSVVDAIGNLYPAGNYQYDGPPTSTVTISRITIVG